MPPELSGALDLLAAPLHTLGGLPFLTRVCFLIAIGAFIGIVVITVGIALNKLIEEQRSRRKALARHHIDKVLLAAVMPQPGKSDIDLSQNGITIDHFIKAGLSINRTKRILVKEMIKYRANFSGKVSANIKRIYMMLSLHKEAAARLNSRRWKVKVQALSELFQMDVASDRDRLLQLLEDKNKYVRDYARLSLIKFSVHDPFQFIRDLNEPISQWEALEIFQLLRDKINYKLPSLAPVISDNKEHTVVSLCLKLAVHFNQIETVPSITMLISTADLTLRAEAIAALGKMHSEASQAFLMDIYQNQPPKIKRAILCALGDIKNDESLRFMEAEFIAEDDFEVKKSASDALIKHYPAAATIIDRLLANGKALDKILLRHSLNPLINNK